MENEICTPALSPLGAVKATLSNPSFKGRSRRSEFWWSTLFILIIELICERTLVVSNVPVISILGLIITIVLIYLLLALNVRRFHDLGYSGWWLFINFAFNISTIIFKNYDFVDILHTMSLGLNLIVLVVCMFDSENKHNEYGYSPKYSTSLEESEILENENDQNRSSFFQKVGAFFAYIFGTLGCLGQILVPVFFLLLLSRWLCDIDPNECYVWYHGIWHGLFVIPNWIISLFDHDVLCKANEYTTGYNIWWWIVLIWEVLGLLGGSSR